jgi:hypothetical protein
MSFLKKIFKSKPGGTFLGNALRGASNKFSGGILGNGAMLKTFETKEGFRDAQGNETQSFKDFERLPMSPQMQLLTESAINGGLETPNAKNQVAVIGIQKFLPWIVLSVVTLIGGFFLLKMNKK